MTWARKGHGRPNDTGQEECWACSWEGWACDAMHAALLGQGLSWGCFDRGWQQKVAHRGPERTWLWPPSVCSCLQMGQPGVRLVVC